MSKSVGALRTLAETALGAFSVHAVTDFLKEAIEVGSVLDDMSGRLGVSADELQRWQYAVAGVGVGAEDAGRALQFLNKNIGDAIGGNKESVKQFAELGVSLKDSEGNVRELGVVIPEVADAFEKMGSDQERTTKAMQLFGKSGAGLIPLLKNGSAELVKLNAEFTELGLGIDDDFIKKADQAGDSIDTLRWGFRALKTRIAVEVLPSITELTKKASRWIAEGIKLTKQTHIVKEGWIAMGIAAAVAFAKVGVGWAKMLGLITGKGGLIKNLIGLGWLGLIIAGVTALYLIFDDLFTLFTGGESLIGEILDDLFGIGTSGQVIEYVKGLWNEMAQAIAALKPLLELLGQWIVAAFEAAWPWMVRFERWTLHNNINAIKAFVAIARWAAETIGGLFSTVGQGLQVAGKLSGKQWVEDGGNALFKAGAGLSLAASGAAAVPDKSDRALGLADVHQSNRVHITVQGGPSNADTGRAVASAVGGVFVDQNRQALASLYGGTGDDD